MKKFIKILSVVLLSFLGFIATLLFYTLKNPHAVLQMEPVQKILLSFLPEDQQLNWEELDIRSSDGPNGIKKLHFSLEGLCFQQVQPNLEFCFEKVFLAFGYQLSWIDFEVKEIGPIKLLAGAASFESSESEEETSRTMQIPMLSFSVPELLEGAKLNEIRIEIPQFMLQSGSETWKGSVDVASSSVSSADETQELRLDAKMSSKAKRTKLSLNMPLPKLLRSSPQELNLQAQYAQAQMNVELQVSLKLNEQSLKGPVKAKVKASGKSYSFNGDIYAEAEKLRLNFDAVIKDFVGEISQIKLSDCNIEYGAPNIGQTDTHANKIPAKISQSNLQVSCPFVINTKKTLGKELGKTYASQIPTLLSGKIESKMKLPFLYQGGDVLEGDIRIQLDPIVQNLYRHEGKLVVHYKGDPTAVLADQNIDLDLDLRLSLPSFARVVDALEHSKFGVIAPFHTMDGSVQISAGGKVQLGAQSQGEIPIELAFDLKSPEQVFRSKARIDVRGKAKGTKLENIDVDAELLLKDVSLLLPTLEIGPLPQVNKDPRFVLKKNGKTDPLDPYPDQVAKDAKVSIPLSYRIGIKTEDEIYLKSNLAKSRIPLSLDLEASDEKGIEGKVGFNEARLSLLRRTAEMKYFNIQLFEKKENNEVDALFHVDYADYRVEINIEGTVNEPNIRLSSKPPLDQSDIVSVLLYGEPLSQTDLSQNENTAEVSNAISDRAMALASLYFLASTPIESVNYDPNQKELTTKIKIADGTSLVLGRSEEQREVGLRKRLGGGWYITTRLENKKNEESTQASTYLEWYNRF